MWPVKILERSGLAVKSYHPETLAAEDEIYCVYSKICLEWTLCWKERHPLIRGQLHKRYLQCRDTYYGKGNFLMGFGVSSKNRVYSYVHMSDQLWTNIQLCCGHNIDIYWILEKHLLTNVMTLDLIIHELIICLQNFRGAQNRSDQTGSGTQQEDGGENELKQDTVWRAPETEGWVWPTDEATEGGTSAAVQERSDGNDGKVWWGKGKVTGQA